MATPDRFPVWLIPLPKVVVGSALLLARDDPFWVVLIGLACLVEGFLDATPLRRRLFRTF